MFRNERVNNAIIIALILLMVGSCLIAVELSVPRAQVCHETSKSKCADHKKQPGGIRTALALLVEFLEEHNGAITSLATIAIAAFTGTLWYATRKMMKSGESQIAIAKDAANAAERSADVAEKALIAGQRAFVSVSFRQSPYRDITTGNIEFWGIIPVWTNAGNTPTRNMENHISNQLTQGELPADWDFPDLWSEGISESDRVAIPLGISPKQETDGQRVTISTSDMDEVISGRKRAYLWGWATYNDVFPNTSRHVTRFAVWIEVGGNPRDPKQISFTYHYLGRYNCSDEECEYQGFSALWKPREMLV